MTLKELLLAVQDKRLNKQQIEEYYNDLTHVYSAVCVELSDLKKSEAFFFMDAKTADPKESDVSIKRKWRVTEKGQRMIELDTYRNVIPKELASLKNRIYSLL